MISNNYGEWLLKDLKEELKKKRLQGVWEKKRLS